MDDDNHTSPPCATCAARDDSFLSAARRREKLTQDILALFCDDPEAAEPFATLTQDTILNLHDRILDAINDYSKDCRLSNLERFAALIGHGVDPKMAAERVRRG